MTLPLEWRASITGTPQVISELQRLKQEYNNGQIGLQEYTQKSRYLNSQLRTVNNSFNQQKNILYATHPALQTMTRAMSVFSHVASTALSVVNALNISNLNTSSIAQEMASGQIELAKEQRELNRIIQEVINEGGTYSKDPEKDPRVIAARQVIAAIEQANKESAKRMKDQAFQNQLTQITAWVNIAAGVGTQIATIWALFRVLKAKMGLGITVPIRYVSGPIPSPAFPPPVVVPLPGTPGFIGPPAPGPLSSAGPPGGPASAVGTGLAAFLAIFGPSIADTILAAFGDAKAQFREEQRRLEGVAFQEKLSGKEPTVGINESGVYVEVVKTSTQATQTLTDTIKEMMIKFPARFASSFYDKYRDVTTSNMTVMDDLGTVIIKGGKIIEENTSKLTDTGKAILKSYEEYRKNNPETNRRSELLAESILLATDSTGMLTDQLKEGINVNVSGGGEMGEGMKYGDGGVANQEWASNYLAGMGSGSQTSGSTPLSKEQLDQYSAGINSLTRAFFTQNGREPNQQERTDINNQVIKTMPGVFAASGYEGLVSKPTMFVAGEAGSEMVSIKPLNSMRTSGGTTIIQYLTVQGSILAEREVERIADRGLKRDLKRVGF